MLAKRKWVIVGFSALAAIGGLCCSRSETPRVPVGPAVGPRDTLRRIMELRAARKYAELRAMILPERGGEVVATLMGLDDLLDANRTLVTWVREQLGSGNADMVNQAYFGDAFGIFGRHVELLDQITNGAQATVAFTSSGRAPVEQARLRVMDGTWRYDPEDEYSDQIPAAFHELARGLDRALADLQAGTPSVAELRDDPQRLVGLVRKELAPGVKQLSRARQDVEKHKGGG
jgi:hypothetical protein